MEDIINPLTQTPCLVKTTKRIVKLRKARDDARALMRSGNPQIRSEAAKAYREAGDLIGAAYFIDKQEQTS